MLPGTIKQHAYKEGVLTSLGVFPITWHNARLNDGTELRLRNTSFDLKGVSLFHRLPTRPSLTFCSSPP
jgi:hypothetical protein